MSKHRDRRESHRSEWSDDEPKDFQEPSFFRQRPAVAPPRAAPQTEVASAETAGTVKFYNSEKGFGFIGLEGGEKDIFVHVSTLSRSGIASLEQGQAVWVTYAQGTKGVEARSVRLG